MATTTTFLTDTFKNECAQETRCLLCRDAAIAEGFPRLGRLFSALMDGEAVSIQRTWLITKLDRTFATLMEELYSQKMYLAETLYPTYYQTAVDEDLTVEKLALRDLLNVETTHADLLTYIIGRVRIVVDVGNINLHGYICEICGHLQLVKTVDVTECPFCKAGMSRVRNLF